MKKREISGTGNGIYDDSQEPFAQAFSKLAELTNSVNNFLSDKDSRGKWFSGGKFHLINNWGNIYKIDIPVSIFPFHLANTYAITCWGRLQVGVVFPLKFEAPTFSGGTTENMNVAFVTEVYIDKIKDFYEDDNYPKELKVFALQDFAEYCRGQREEKYKGILEQTEWYLKEHEENKAQAELEIPELEVKIKEIKKLLKKKI